MEPKCMNCGEPATCYGTYEGVTGYSCDDCCGHGCEDGHCVPLEDTSNYTELRDLVAGEPGE